MAFFLKSMEKLKGLEYSNPKDALHRLSGENGYTYMGVYESANPRWIGWSRVYQILSKYRGSIERASQELYSDPWMNNQVNKLYREEYWNMMKLDYVVHQHIADEMFIFGVNVHPRKAIKKAQKLVGVKVDGWIGANTLKALNSYDPRKFDIEFDKVEIAYYYSLAFFSKRKAHYRQFYKGWVNRARAV